MTFLFVPSDKCVAIDIGIWLTQKVYCLTSQIPLNFLKSIPQVDKIFGNMNADFDHLNNAIRLE